MERWKNKGINLKFIRCDDAGENKKLEEELIKRQMGVQFEYTGAGTPQHNGVVERAFATLMGRTRAMLTAAGMSNDIRKKLWAECAGTATKLDNLLVGQKNEKNKAEIFLNETPKYANHLRTFVDIGIVLNQKGKKT